MFTDKMRGLSLISIKYPQYNGIYNVFFRIQLTPIYILCLTAIISVNYCVADRISNDLTISCP